MSKPTVILIRNVSLPLVMGTDAGIVADASGDRIGTGGADPEFDPSKLDARGMRIDLGLAPYITASRAWSSAVDGSETNRHVSIPLRDSCGDKMAGVKIVRSEYPLAPPLIPG